MKDFSWEYSGDLDIDAMNSAGAFLIGRHDFTSFSKLHTDVKTNVCEVFEAFWQESAEFLIFRIKSDRFLRNMVRAIVGTLIEVGKGKYPPGEMEKILGSADRSNAGMSVPGQGLFLTRVDYSPDVFRVECKPPFFTGF
jgi:tRNA pseudouridine38-40 synthase